MSDPDLRVYEPTSLTALTGAYGAALSWSEETVDGKGRGKVRTHSLRLTPAMRPMLMAALSALQRAQASLATCVDGEE